VVSILLISERKKRGLNADDRVFTFQIQSLINRTSFTSTLE